VEPTHLINPKRRIPPLEDKVREVQQVMSILDSSRSSNSNNRRINRVSTLHLELTGDREDTDLMEATVTEAEATADTGKAREGKGGSQFR
jgi:hypothetical protein